MRVPGVPFDPAVTHGAMSPMGGVLHRTYGSWPGDYSVGKNNPNGVGFQFLIGKAEGRWVQFTDSNAVCWHAPGANRSMVGIEFEGSNSQPLTDWQVRAGAWIISALSNAYGWPREYWDGARRAPHPGWTTHASVLGSDHTDRVTREDWDRMMALSLPVTPPPPIPPAPDEPQPVADFRRMEAGMLLTGAGAVPVPIREGDSGLNVAWLQRALNDLTGSTLTVDGQFGPATGAKVADFQRLLGLDVDGVVGNVTKLWLIASLTNIRDGKA